MVRRLKVAGHKLASCSGCLATIADALLPYILKGDVELGCFALLADPEMDGEYDVGFVEGSVATEEQEGELREFRRRVKFLVAVGACALFGGPQSINPGIAKLVEDVVAVDYRIPGCPIEEWQVREVINHLMRGTRPPKETETLCTECRRMNVPCVAITKGLTCLGPAVMAGCSALCPSFGRGCYGCRGPSPGTSIKPLLELDPNALNMAIVSQEKVRRGWR